MTLAGLHLDSLRTLHRKEGGGVEGLASQYRDQDRAGAGQDPCRDDRRRDGKREPVTGVIGS